MEDALALPKSMLSVSNNEVLILVVMEDALALVKRSSKKTLLQSVLILVVMEDALAPITPIFI